MKKNSLAVIFGILAALTISGCTTLTTSGETVVLPLVLNEDSCDKYNVDEMPVECTHAIRYAPQPDGSFIHVLIPIPERIPESLGKTLTSADSKALIKMFDAINWKNPFPVIGTSLFKGRKNLTCVVLPYIKDDGQVVSGKVRVQDCSRWDGEKQVGTVVLDSTIDVSKSANWIDEFIAAEKEVAAEKTAVNK